jgi:hypothetical protein
MNEAPYNFKNISHQLFLVAVTTQVRTTVMSVILAEGK